MSKTRIGFPIRTVVGIAQQGVERTQQSVGIDLGPPPQSESLQKKLCQSPP